MTVELLHGDCMEHMAEMQPNSIDAIVCDPPSLADLPLFAVAD